MKIGIIEIKKLAHEISKISKTKQFLILFREAIIKLFYKPIIHKIISNTLLANSIL